MRRTTAAIRAALCFAGLFIGGCAPDPPPAPNILLVVADDLGYTDLGVYGGEIRTPRIDALAEQGLLFTRFHAGPACEVTRAMLLSGNNHHVAGMRGEGAHLSDRVAPLPRLLRQAGYRTYMTGKWHLGATPERSPGAAGFERYFALLPGAGSHFNSLSWGGDRSRYLSDGVDVDYPDGEYSTDVYTNRLIELLEEGRGRGGPFFALAAYTSPHWPLQVPTDELGRYAGRYDDGYEALRRSRLESAVRLGLVSAKAAPAEPDDRIPPWSELSLQERRRQAREMELYAAMVENLDRHVGRLIDYLKASGQYEHTLVVFMSDNGFNSRDRFRTEQNAEYFDPTFDNSLENLGRATSWIAPGPEWAEASTAHFSRYKQYVRQGGLLAPLIVAGPPVARAGSHISSYVTVMDLAPTFIELGGAAYPTDGSVAPMRGESMVSVLRGDADAVHSEDYVNVMYHHGRALVRQGDWKLVTLDGPFDEAKFALFDLSEDPGETTDLAERQPERYQAMLQLWRQQRREVGIRLPGEDD